MILLIDNYDSFTFNLFQMVESLGRPCRVVRNDKITLSEIERLDPSLIILSPGPGNPPSAGLTLPIIRRFAGIFPMFGVCLGHQAIGEAFGARVVRAAVPMHGKRSRILHDGKGIFSGLEGSFSAVRYHSLIVDRKSIPDVLEISCETEDGLIMGLRHRNFPIEGVQFHPESFATDHGRMLVETLLERRGA